MIITFRFNSNEPRKNQNTCTTKYELKNIKPTTSTRTHNKSSFSRSTHNFHLDTCLEYFVHGHCFLYWNIERMNCEREIHKISFKRRNLFTHKKINRQPNDNKWFWIFVALTYDESKTNDALTLEQFHIEKFVCFFFFRVSFYFSWIRLHKNDTQQFIVLSVVVVVVVVTLFFLLCLWYFFCLVFAFCTPLRSDSLSHWRYNSHNTATATLMSLKCYNAY